MKSTILSLLAIASSVSAWLPHERNFFGDAQNTTLSIGQGRFMQRSIPNNKIRGVNLGSLFIIEPWMAGDEWRSMGCGDAKSEFDCVLALGQEAADEAFRDHWDRWITEEDLDKMKEWGLNTVRVPVGYWIVEETVWRDSEHFPQGGMEYLDRLAGWAADRDLYVILDLHGAPGAQEPYQPFTGQYAPVAGFYVSWQFDRAYKFLEVMTDRIHSNDNYRTTGMIEVLNEPSRDHYNELMEFYGRAYEAVRNVEDEREVPDEQRLSIQYMDKSWGAGNPNDVVGGRPGLAYDNHRYLKWAPVEHTKQSYISTSCNDQFGDGDNTPVIIGEWSISPKTEIEGNDEWTWSNEGNKAFYTQWWAAQVTAYERQLGWVFWSWKTQLGGDFRWSYRQSVEAGVIPMDINHAAGLAKC